MGMILEVRLWFIIQTLISLFNLYNPLEIGIPDAKGKRFDKEGFLTDDTTYERALLMHTRRYLLAEDCLRIWYHVTPKEIGVFPVTRFILHP